MRQIDQLLKTYGESHQNKTNKLIHWIMVPLIFFSIVGLLMSIPVLGFAKTPFMNFGALAFVFALIYYFKLSKPLFVGFVFWAFFCLYSNFYIYKSVGYSNSNLALISLGIFVIAWIFQFIGHKIEGAKPSFLDDIKFLLIGPAWLLHFVYKRLGIKY